MKKGDKQQIYAAFSLVGTIGISMVVCVAIGLFLGRMTDRWLDTSPWATVIGIVLGMVTSFWTLYKRVIEIERDE